VLYQVDGSSILSVYFSNLQELKVSGKANENLWANLRQLDLPHLTKLEISGIDMEPENVEALAGVFWELRSNNLEELRLGTFSSAAFVDEWIWKDFVFPKLKSLTLCTEDIGCFWGHWYLLMGASCPVLEYLTVESDTLWNEENEEEGPIPKMGDEEFNGLPMLKDIKFVLEEPEGEN